ncbi:hypothetical protein [Archangium sp.]|uniref:hypothetical protein n=1 Tax=Archangium sp. TaxID=1872627 RepID=UPI00286BCB43|nr:hypothetical protein [Archangium sp.]
MSPPDDGMMGREETSTARLEWGSDLLVGQWWLPNRVTYPWAANSVTFSLPVLLEIQHLGDAWVSFEQVVQANDSRPITRLMLLSTKDLPVAILMHDQPDRPASFEHMTANECGTFAFQAQLQFVALELTVLWRNPFSIQLLGPFFAVAIAA